MKTIRNVLFRTALAATSTLSVFADGNNVAPYLALRPAAQDLAKKLAGTTSHHRDLFGMETSYGYFSVDFDYTASFRPGNIAHALFGAALQPTTTTSDCSEGRQITVSGSQVAGTRGSFELMAENFYLPRDFKSTLSFKPKHEQFVVNFDFYMELSDWCEGLFIEITAPVVHSRNDLQFEETISSAGTSTTGAYAAGYFDSAPVATANLVTSFANYANGSVAAKGTNVTAQTLNYAKIDKERHAKTEFGEIHFNLGYNVWQNEDGHFGLLARVGAPTGKRPDATFLFEPRGTNGHHWELGGGLDARYILWRSDDELKNFAINVAGDFVHLFKDRQHRTFDLNGKPLSRYMLAEKMQKNTGNLAAGATDTTTTTPGYQFAGEYAPVANISTLDVNVSIPVQADVVAMFTFTSKGLTWDLGYEFFGRSKEKIHDVATDSSCGDSKVTFAANTWALKGNASVYGFDGTGSVPLSATNNAATIFASAITTATNGGVDSQALAWRAVDANRTALNATTSGGTQINTSTSPVLLALTDLNISGAETKAQSHALFTHLGYTWDNREDWVPFIGVGAKVEFGRHNHHTDDTSVTTSLAGSSSTNCALSQWSIWFKGGVSFN